MSINRATLDGKARATRPRILIAGIGNILRRDDGFGPAVIKTLESAGHLPEGTRCVELGIGGIGLVHELMEQYEALILLDAVDRGGPPGAVYVLEVTAPSATEVLNTGRFTELVGDVHRAVPNQALIIAQAAGVLPPLVRLVGCQPAETEEFAMELTPVVQRAVHAAAEQVRVLVGQWCGAVHADSSIDSSSHHDK